MTWPPYSPDLNPIETIWNVMKDWIQEHHPEEVNDYQVLRTIVQQAWESVGSDVFQRQIATMPRRMQDVIAANGGPTKW
jgi:hypothetical protein